MVNKISFSFLRIEWSRAPLMVALVAHKFIDEKGKGLCTYSQCKKFRGAKSLERSGKNTHKRPKKAFSFRLNC
jgi:hypothetical protein